jgi:hypothetical protein
MVRFAALAALVCAGSCSAQSMVVIVADRDTTLYESSTGGLGNGSGQHLFTGRTAQVVEQRRGLVRFDIAAVVPTGSSISSVSLEMTCSRTNAPAGVVELRRVLQGWGEGRRGLRRRGDRRRDRRRDLAAHVLHHGPVGDARGGL